VEVRHWQFLQAGTTCTGWRLEVNISIPTGSLHLQTSFAPVAWSEEWPSPQSGVTSAHWLELCRGGPDVGTMRSTPL